MASSDASRTSLSSWQESLRRRNSRFGDGSSALGSDAHDGGGGVHVVRGAHAFE